MVTPAVGFNKPDNDTVSPYANPRSIWFESDIYIMRAGGYDTGVVSGGAVTAGAGPSLSVSYAVGVDISLGAQLAVSSGSVALSAAHATLTRIDLAVVNSIGTKVIREGTPALNPKPPMSLLQTGDVVHAFVTVPGNAGIGNITIDDHRWFVSAAHPISTGKAGGQTIAGGTGVTDFLKLKSTTGVGTTDYIAFLVGNNGATEAMRLHHNGAVTIRSDGVTSMPTTSTLVVQSSPTGSYVLADFAVAVAGNSADVGAVRAIATQTAAYTTTALRGIEAHGVRYAAAGQGGTMGAEIGVHTAVAGDGVSYNYGIYLTSDTNFLPAGGARADIGLVFTGNLGYTHAIRYYETSGGTVLFNVDQYGHVGLYQAAAATYSLDITGPAGASVLARITAPSGFSAYLGLVSNTTINSIQTDTSGNFQLTADGVAAGVITVIHAAAVANTLHALAGRVGIGAAPGAGYYLDVTGPTNTSIQARVLASGTGVAYVVLQSAGAANAIATNAAGDVTVDSNGVAAAVITMIHAGAVANSVYITAGKVGFGTATVDTNTRITIAKGGLAYIEFPTGDGTALGAYAGRLPSIVAGALKYIPYYS